MNPGLLDPYWTSDVLMDDDPFTDMTPDDGFMHDFSTAQSRGWYDRRGISRHPNVFCSYFIYYRKHGYVKNTPPKKLIMESASSFVSVLFAEMRQHQRYCSFYRVWYVSLLVSMTYTKGCLTVQSVAYMHCPIYHTVP